MTTLVSKSLDLSNSASDCSSSSLTSGVELQGRFSFR